MIPRKCLVLLSGGMDSVTCLGLALGNYQSVEAISFFYNQRHAVELERAAELTAKHNVPHKVVHLDALLADLVTSALTDPKANDDAVNKPHPDKPGLPASFVPGRNALFLTLAHAWAQTIGAAVVMSGMCQTDYSGYPDCRELFVKQLQAALNVGYETNIVIETPLMWVDKAETFAIAEEWNFLPEVLRSLSCYNGDDKTEHPWGNGCGTCPSCRLRAAGWTMFESKAYAARRVKGREHAAALVANTTPPTT